MGQFLLPDLGEGLEEAQLVQWHVAEGETVTLNQALCQVETAKALVDIPSPYAGVVARLHARPGDTVLVGAPLVTISEQSSVPLDEGASERTGPVLVGYGTEGPPQPMLRRRRVPVGATPPQTSPSANGGAEAQVAASPLVRKMAAEHGINLHDVRGSGPGGRIRAEDLDSLIATATRTGPPEVATAARTTTADESGDERISTVGLRKAIAARMVRSATTIPQFTEYGLFDASALVALRARLRAEPPYVGVRLTYLPFFVLALVAAICEYPIMNSRWDEEGNAIIVRKAIHVGIATDTARGLLVPVIHGAHQRSMGEIAAEVARLVDAARSGTLDAASLSGGTITITNVGAAGPVETGAPLINPPEACVVGFGAIKPRPTVVGNDVYVRPGAWISISCDHRIVDGATAASFLGALVRYLEAPDVLTARG